MENEKHNKIDKRVAKQTGVAARNAIAGDAEIIEIENFISGSIGYDQLKQLSDNLLKEVENAPDLESSYKIIDDLLDYDIDDAKFNKGDLEKKLGSANLARKIDRALFYKEKFRRTLERFAYYRNAQKIYALLCSYIAHLYDTYIEPEIYAGLEGDDLYKKFSEKLVNPIATLIPESPLSATHDQVWGIVFFMSGNCFIDWSKPPK